MESLLRDALLNEQLNADIQFDQMKTIYDVNRAPLDKKTARALVAFLLSKCGQKTESKVNPELLPKAKAALGVLTFMLSQDQEFQAAFETYGPSVLKKKLKLERHVREGPEDHRKTVYQLVYIMRTRFRKFSDWKDYVAAPAREQVAAGLKAIEDSVSAGGEAPAVYRPPESCLPPPGQYHDQSWEKVADIFETDVKKGLTTDEAQLRCTRYGKNALPRPKPPSPWKILLEQLADFMVIILLVVTVLEIVVNIVNLVRDGHTSAADWVAVIVLFLVVFFNVLVGFLQEMKAQKALEALENLQVPHASVMRDGNAETLESAQLVPGDIVMLDEGCQVPADLRLVEAINLEVMEAVLTGESEAVLKTTAPLTQSGLALGDIKNMCFMGTSVMRGRGVGIVTATGKTSEVGKISKEMAKTEDTQTLLQKRLKGLGKVLVILAVVLCIIVVAINLIRYYAAHHLGGEQIFEAVETGISLGVSVIPEGLIAVTTITMALGVQRMAKNNAVVKRLAVVESLGSITVICSDKTGTLTEGKMKAEELSCGSLFHFSGTGSSPEGEIFDADEKQYAQNEYPARLKTALMACALCNNSSISFHEDIGEYVPVGDPTEVAILLAAEKGKMNKGYWLEQGWEFIDEVAFDSDRKCMSVLYHCTKKSNALHVVLASGNTTDDADDKKKSKKDKKKKSKKSKKDDSTTTTTTTTTEAATSEGEVQKYRSVLLAKGAPESVINNCNRKMSLSGEVSQMTKKDIKKLEQEALEMASRGLRVLALAMKPMQDDEYTKDGQQKLADHEHGLVYLGLIGLIDPPRLEVKGAIEECRGAGINVVMITGDHPLTAMAIAKQLNIVTEEDEREAVEQDDEEDGGRKMTEREREEAAGSVEMKGAPRKDAYLMKGSDLDAYTESDMDLLVDLNPFPRVFARVSPQHKLKIVEALKKRGEICAMTGDGVNDAPAIKKASVGVAMGKTGTDLTKDAASMILMDDNFKTIVLAIREGRVIYDNIKKFILYLLSCNSAEVYTMLLCGIIGLPVPFSAIMILWVNLIADLPPALSLGVDPAEPDVMTRRPRNPKDNIFNLRTVILLLFQGFSIAALTVLVYGLTLLYEAPDALHLGYRGALYTTVSGSSLGSSAPDEVVDSSATEQAQADLVRCQTLCLNVMTFMQLVHAYLSRSVRNTVFQRNIFSNYWLVGGVLLSAACMVIGVYVPGLNSLLGQTSLPAIDWAKILGACVVHILFVEVYKVVLRLKARNRVQGKWYDEV